MPMALRKNKPQNFRSKNLQTFQQRSPQMVDYLQKVTPGVETTIVGTPSRSPTLTYRQGNRLFHLHSAYEPIAEANQWAEHVGQEDWQIGVILGIGLGYHIEELQRRYPERSLVVVEPTPDIFNAAIQVRDLRTLLRHPNFSIVASSDATAASVSLFENHIRSGVIKGQVKFFAWPPYQRVWSSFWQQVQQKIGELTRQSSVNFSTYQYFSMMWQENFFTNLRASVMDPSAKALYSLFKGKPAILVAAGPSLQKNIHLLKELKESALIVAAGSALGPLLAHGIKPHLVVSFDGAPANYYVFADVKTDDLVMVYSSVIYPRIVAEFQGPRFALGVDIYPYERWFHAQLGHDRGSVASGPSIANLTWDLLRQMACDPIIFVGQDLAFGHDGETHAAGRVELDYEFKNSATDTLSVEQRASGEWVEDIWGNQVRTRPVWLAMKTWFEHRIYAWGQGRTFIDATEGGAKIKGTQIMSLRDAADRYCKQQINAEMLIWQTYRSQKAQLDTLNLDSKLDLALKRILQDFAAILKLCDSAIEQVRSLDALNRDNQCTESEYARYHAMMSRYDAQLSTFNAYTQFIRPAIENNTAAFDAMSIRLQIETDTGQKGKKLAELYASLFAIVQKAATELNTYCQIAVDMPGPYSPVSLASEINYVSSICSQMRPHVETLQSLSKSPIDETVWSQVQKTHEELGRLSTQINQTEVLRTFVKEVVVLEGAAMQELRSFQIAASTERDLQRKAEYLAMYHERSLDAVQSALRKICEYSKIPT
jgi:hypothetical protein